MAGRGRQRASRADWLEAALETLARDGVDGVRVERLARSLGIAKSGFYWHFRDRDDLLKQLLRFWAHEYTGVVSENPQLQAGDPADRLRRTMHMILDADLTRYELAFRAWAEQDPKVAAEVRRVYRDRLDFVRGLLAELGFEGDELEMRARLFVAYHSWERVTFSKEPKRRLRALIDRRLTLLIRR
jgi:AcrR family transcriptional regulator